jgi:myosin heavy subunit
LAGATVKLNFDVSQIRSEIDSLKNIFKKVNFGKEISGGITEEFKKLEQRIQALSKQKISLTSSPEEVSAYVRNVKDVENIQKNITQQLQRELAVRLQTKNLTVDDVRKMQDKVTQTRNTIALKQQELQIAQQLQKATIGSTRDIDNAVAKAKENLDIAKKTLESRKQEHTIAAQQATVDKRQKIYNDLLAKQSKYLEMEKQIGKIRKDIVSLETTESIESEKLKTYQDEINLANQVEKEINDVAEARKRDTKTAKESATAINQSWSEQKQMQSSINKNVENLIIKMKRLAEFTIAAFAVRYIRQFVTEGLRFIQELDKALTEIATVTGKTRDEMWLMAEEFNRMGRELGKTTTEITKASVIFYRQGLTTAEVLDMVRASTISAAIANTDAAEASNRLTAALRGYNLASSEAINVADKMAALAAKSASSFDEISYAMTKTAASAAVAGIDIDHLYGYLAKVIETTRYNIAA